MYQTVAQQYDLPRVGALHLTFYQQPRGWMLALCLLCLCLLFFLTLPLLVHWMTWHLSCHFRGMELVGRGGMPYIRPEHTLVSYRACAGWCDGVETVLRETRDGVWVAMEDPTVDRTTNATGRVEEWDYHGPAGLEHVSAGFEDRYPTGVYRSERVPTSVDLARLVKTYQIPGLVVQIAPSPHTTQATLDWLVMNTTLETGYGVPHFYLSAEGEHREDLDLVQAWEATYYRFTAGRGEGGGIWRVCRSFWNCAFHMLTPPKHVERVVASAEDWDAWIPWALWEWIDVHAVHPMYPVTPPKEKDIERHAKSGLKSASLPNPPLYNPIRQRENVC